MGARVDWSLIQEEIQYKYHSTPQSEAPLFHGVHGVPWLQAEKVHYQDLIAAAAQNFGEALFGAVEKFWVRKFHRHVQFGECYRSCQIPTLIQKESYDLGTTVFYAREKLHPLEVQELKWFVRFYFHDRGVEFLPSDFEVLVSLDKAKPEWFCYVVRFSHN